MSELLVRVVDKINADFYLNCGCTKRGDVIVVREDGHVWGNDELTLPFWAVVKLPNVSVQAASVLLAPELPVDPLHPSPTLQKRAFKLDVDNAAIATIIAADTRALPDLDAIPLGGIAPPTPATVAADGIGDLDIAGLTIAKPAIADPAVIGDPVHVIG